METKGEARKRRQAEYAARQAERQNDTRTARERFLDEQQAATKRRRKAHKPVERRPEPGSAEWAETRGDDLGESPDY